MIGDYFTKFTESVPLWYIEVERITNKNKYRKGVIPACRKRAVWKSNLLRIILDLTIKENAYNEQIIKPFTDKPTPPRQRGTVCLRMPADKTKV